MTCRVFRVVAHGVGLPSWLVDDVTVAANAGGTAGPPASPRVWSLGLVGGPGLPGVPAVAAQSRAAGSFLGWAHDGCRWLASGVDSPVGVMRRTRRGRVPAKLAAGSPLTGSMIVW